MKSNKRFNNPEELEKYQGDYSEPKFWEKLKKFAGKLGKDLVYQILLLYYVMVSGDVDLKHKTIIIGALGYLILPVDLIPDFIPVLGFTDDAAAIAIALKTVRESITPEIEAQAQQKLSEWF